MSWAYTLLLIEHIVNGRLKAGNSCYYSVQTLLSSWNLCKNLKIKTCKTILPVVLYAFEKKVSYNKEGTQAKGIWIQDSETNIWDQGGLEWGVEALQWGTS